MSLGSGQAARGSSFKKWVAIAIARVRLGKKKLLCSPAYNQAVKGSEAQQPKGYRRWAEALEGQHVCWHLYQTEGLKPMHQGPKQQAWSNLIRNCGNWTRSDSDDMKSVRPCILDLQQCDLVAAMRGVVLLQLCRVLDIQTKEIIGHGTKKDGLYYVDDVVPRRANLVYASHNSNLQQWY
ncbi:hypothetical protein D8674_033274 [Pyrus ussuriensis x Pyrus communis]|uniref:Uncharacterized protein n=1 Tax=Pyrus ussuriensis x Pyrus communis TaxID=2448454 RepID=A0A5N5HKN7_9ROSA|nr:hypothetical protein D8674_033274 [Pyrus ussuriensis x Pyrus communis]